MADFSLTNLSANPSFNFLNSINKANDEDENIPNFSFSDSPYDNSTFSCTYLSESEFTLKFKNCTKPIVLSVNIQSLQSKYNELCTFINNLQLLCCEPDIICLQEIWKIPDGEFFPLDGYHPLVFKSRHNNVQGGGVGIYVKKCHNFIVNNSLSIFADRIFESIFIDISFNSKKNFTRLPL